MKSVFKKISLRNVFIVMNKYSKKENFDLGRIFFMNYFDLQKKLVKLQKNQSINDASILCFEKNEHKYRFNIAIRVPKRAIKLATERNLLKRRFLHALYLHLKTHYNQFFIDNNIKDSYTSIKYLIFNIEKNVSFLNMQESIARINF